MSHVAVRLLANRLDDSVEGINAIAKWVPRFTGDQIPPDVTIYDETRTGFVARGQTPQPGTGVEFPCVVVYLQSITPNTGVADSQSTGARSIDGQLVVVAQLLMQETDTEEAASAGMYLLRALRGAVLRFDDPSNHEARTACYSRIDPSQNVVQGRVSAFVSDSVCSPGALLITYPFTETVPLN